MLLVGKVFYSYLCVASKLKQSNYVFFGCLLQQHDHSHKLNKGDRETLNNGGFPKKVGFYTRHNPHPGIFV